MISMLVYQLKQYLRTKIINHHSELQVVKYYEIENSIFYIHCNANWSKCEWPRICKQI